MRWLDLILFTTVRKRHGIVKTDLQICDLIYSVVCRPGIEPGFFSIQANRVYPLNLSPQVLIWLWREILFLPIMTTAGFEPAKRDAQDLKSRPFDQTWVRCLLPSIKKDFIHDGIRTRNLQIRSLTRYPIAPHGQVLRYEFNESNFLNLIISLAGLEPATSGS